jgi:SAM-dependent methyltransferase
MNHTDLSIDRVAGQHYAEAHSAIFAATLQQLAAWVLPDRPLRILELGAAPYSFTTLLLRSIRCEVTCVSAPPQVWPGEMVGVTHTQVELGEPMQRVPVALLNLERELLPFANQSFDVVLCMDVLQNLAYHPTLLFCEAQRVLTRQGRLLLTVPNGLSLWRLLWLLCGIVDLDPFAARGMYERRQRSSTPQEVRKLIAGCGFQIERFDLLNLAPLPSAGWPRRLSWVARRLTSLPVAALQQRRDYLLLTATPVGQPQAVYPAELYHYVRLYPRIPGAHYGGEQH